MDWKIPMALLSLAVLLSGCVEPIPDWGFEPADDSQATEEGVQNLVEGNNQLAFDLYQKLLEEEQGNVFFSPWSIESALGMTYEGAKGQTAEEMEKVLHLPADDIERQSSFARLYNEINQPNPDFLLHTANALWLQKDYPFQQEYMDAVENYYKGATTNLDFVSNAEGARQTINAWVESHTNGKIKNIIPPGVLNSLTRLVLTNAVYFKGTWALEFDEADTKKEDFETGSGTIKADMMAMYGEKFNYAETESLQALEMPYKGEKLSMLVLLPKEDLASIQSELSAEKLEEIKGMLRKQDVEIHFPKFRFETKYFMVPTLREMGMPTIFTENADLSGIGGKKGELYVTSVIHQAFVEVNEEGTEAAAATVVTVGITSVGPMEPKVFRADHPFIFLIQDMENGEILFFGKVADPTAAN
jgi:serpin B